MRLLIAFFARRMWAYILGTVIVSDLFVFHESSHFLVGKALGMGFSKYQLGFRPSVRLFFVNKTEVLIGMIPLGAFVEPIRLAKLDTCIAEAPLQRAFLASRSSMLVENIPWPGRFVMILTGPLSNLFLGGFNVAGRQWLRVSGRLCL